MSFSICKMPRWLPTRTSLFQIVAGIAVIGVTVTIIYPL